MADTIMTYKRGSRGSDQIARMRVPSDRGMAAQVSAERQYIAGIDAFAKAGGKVANAYFTAIENREARDADTYASKVFRDRRIEILQTVKGKDADGLIDRESQWADEQFEDFTDKYKIDTVKAKEIWRKHKDTYLDRTGAYMVEQQAAYDKQSRLAASDAVIDDMVNTNIGDIDSILLAFVKNDELFEHDPAMAEKQNDKAILAAVGAWARQNPQATVAWFNQNKEALKEQFGSKFINVSDMVDRAEAKIQAEARHAEVLAQRAERLDRQRKAQYSEQVFSGFLTLLARGEADATALFALTDDPNVSSADKVQAYNLMKGTEKALQSRANEDIKKQQDTLESQLVAETYVNKGPEVQAKAIQALREGKITPEAFNNIQNNINKANSIPDSVKAFVTDARNTLKNNYANVPVGFTQDPKSLDQYNMLIAAVTERISTHPESAAKDFNQIDPNSWFNQLMRDNPPLKRTAIVTLGEQFDPSSRYTVNKSETKPGVPSKKSHTPKGNSLIDKLNAQRQQQ